MKKLTNIKYKDETKHILIVGQKNETMTELKELYSKQKKKNTSAKFIIQDTSGKFIEQFYNEKTDYIYDHLNSKIDIIKWLKSESQSTIFISKDIESSDFIDSFIDIVLKGKENWDRRIYLYLTNIEKMNKISTLEKSLIIGRAYGLSVIVNIENINDLKTHGEYNTIINNFSNKVILNNSIGKA